PVAVPSSLSFSDSPPPETHTLSLHDALPILLVPTNGGMEIRDAGTLNGTFVNGVRVDAAPMHEGDVVTIGNIDLVFSDGRLIGRDRKSTRLNSSHVKISYAVFCLKKKKHTKP